MSISILKSTLHANLEQVFREMEQAGMATRFFWSGTANSICNSRPARFSVREKRTSTHEVNSRDHGSPLMTDKLTREESEDDYPKTTPAMLALVKALGR